MKTKKIWVGAFIFGLITTAILYITVFNGLQPVQPASATENKTTDLPEKEEVEPTQVASDSTEQNDAEKPNSMLPISDGKRAISLELTEVQGLSGFITPGSYIDIVSVQVVPEKKFEDQHDAASLLLQNIKVLAVGHAANTKEEAKRYGTITIEVSPYEGLVLGFATKNELYIMLRKEGDKSVEPEHTHVHEDVLHKGVFYK